jgi:nicotinamide-nucleotide amidase
VIVEVVAVGTELLLGQIVNGNAAVIGAALAENGFDAHHQSVVGDNVERIAQVLRAAVARADSVVVTGGIGPTRDDLTREAMCLAFSREMKFSEAYAAELEARWSASGRQMPLSNLRQAEYPDGAELLPNPKGSAPGLVIDQGGTIVFAVPGVPEEMVYLLEREVLPRLRRLAGAASVLTSRVLRTWGRSESQVGEILDDLYQSTNPSIAFLASGGEIKVRITAKGPSESDTQAMIAPVEAEIRRRLGSGVFAVDSETIDQIIATLLRERGWTIGTAESATGGLVAARLTSRPGTSDYFRGGVVTYATDLKTALLGIDRFDDGVVSEKTALEMAAAVRGLLGVDVGLGVVGSAGPEPQEKPVGTMIVAVVTPTGSGVRTLHLPGDRERVLAYTTTTAFHLIRLALTGQWWES